MWTPNAPAGCRILSATVPSSSAAGNGALSGSAFTPIAPAATYRVITTNFLLNGGDGYTVFTQGQNQNDTGFLLADVLSDHIAANSPVSAATEGRITVADRTYLPLIMRKPAS